MNVLLFGAEAAAVGAREVSIDVDDQFTAGELKAMLAERYPGLSESCRVAVNQRFVTDDAKVSALDEVALIGPVSGG